MFARFNRAVEFDIENVEQAIVFVVTIRFLCFLCVGHKIREQEHEFFGEMFQAFVIEFENYVWNTFESLFPVSLYWPRRSISLRIVGSV